jgi:hypothetical protein
LRGLPRVTAARWVSGGFFIIVLLLSGCAAPLQLDRLDPARFPDPIELTAVPFFPQDEYQCGPAALATVLSWAGANVMPATLTPQVYLPERLGSLQPELLGATRRHGMIPYVLRPQLETLLREVAAGQPVLVLQNRGLSWYPKWHYAVVIGFDMARAEVILRSGLERRHVVPLTVFERTWRRGEYWAMVVTPPSRLPVTAEEIAYVQAVAALERLQRWNETALAYSAALSRWPRSLPAQLGLGNSRYALRDFAGAELAYRDAVARHPTSADALNNLAQALAAQQRWSQAEAIARRAVALGGARGEIYQATLTDILARRTH